MGLMVSARQSVTNAGSCGVTTVYCPVILVIDLGFEWSVTFNNGHSLSLLLAIGGHLDWHWSPLTGLLAQGLACTKSN
jgi:hypothetical protein